MAMSNMNSRSRSRKNIDKLGPNWASRLEEARLRRAAALAAKEEEVSSSEQPKPWEILGEPATPALIDEGGSAAAGASKQTQTRQKATAKTKSNAGPDAKPAAEVMAFSRTARITAAKDHPHPEPKEEPASQFGDADVFAMRLPGPVPETDVEAVASRGPRKVNIAIHAEEEPQHRRVAAWIAAGVFVLAAGGLSYSVVRFSQGMEDVVGISPPLTQAAFPELPDIAPIVGGAPTLLSGGVIDPTQAPFLPSELSAARLEARLSEPLALASTPDPAYLPPFEAGPLLLAEITPQPVAPSPEADQNVGLAPETTLAALAAASPGDVPVAGAPGVAPSLDVAAPQGLSSEPDLTAPLSMQVAAPSVSDAPAQDQDVPQLAALAPAAEPTQPLAISGAVAPGAAPQRLDLSVPQSGTVAGDGLLPPLPMLQVAAPPASTAPNLADPALPQLAELDDVTAPRAVSLAPTSLGNTLQPYTPLGAPLSAVQLTVATGTVPTTTSAPDVSVAHSNVVTTRTHDPIGTAPTNASLPLIPAALPDNPVRVTVTLPMIGAVPEVGALEGVATVESGLPVDPALVTLQAPQNAEVALALDALIVPPEPLPTGITVVVHAPSTTDPVLVASAAEIVASATRYDVDVRPPVNFTISSSNVRYFHEGDREAAEIVAAQLDATLRDFTDFSPRPETGTVEVWLRGTSAAARPAPAPQQPAATAVATPRPQSTTSRPAPAAKPVFKTTKVTRTRSGAVRINGQ